MKQSLTIEANLYAINNTYANLSLKVVLFSTDIRTNTKKDFESLDFELP